MLGAQERLTERDVNDIINGLPGESGTSKQLNKKQKWEQTLNDWIKLN